MIILAQIPIPSTRIDYPWCVAGTRRNISYSVPSTMGTFDINRQSTRLYWSVQHPHHVGTSNYQAPEFEQRHACVLLV